jgi:hypothetical protein
LTIHGALERPLAIDARITFEATDLALRRQFAGYVRTLEQRVERPSANSV